MRSRFLLFVALFLSLTVHAESRRRAVRAPGPECSFSLSVGFADPVESGGLMDGVVNVIATPASCTSWAAYTMAGWITIERAGMTAFLRVEPNASAQPRTAPVIIAGVPLTVTQLGAISPPINEPNLLQNGSFPLDVSHWSWQERFPNGTGQATWSPLDANLSIASGSMHMTDDFASPQAFSQSQCVPASPGFYDYGFAVRANSRDTVRGIIAFLEFFTEDCSGTYPAYSVKQIRVDTPGVWQRAQYTEYLNDDKRAFMLIVGGWAREAGEQELWLDDIFVRPREVINARP